jgi:hypothetical protein
MKIKIVIFTKLINSYTIHLLAGQEGNYEHGIDLDEEG